MRTRTKFLIVSLILLVAGVFILYKNRVAIVSFVVPAIEHDTVFVNIINDTAYVQTILFAKNKTFIPLTIDSIKYKIALEDRVYLQEQKFLDIQLESYSADTFDFSLKIPVGVILADIKELRKTTENVNYSILVAIQYSTIFGSVDLPISKDAQFKLPTPPELKIEDVTYHKFRLKDMPVVVRVKFINYNNLSMTFKSLSYHLEIPHRGEAEGVYNKEISIRPQSELYLDLHAIIQWKHFGKTILDVIKDNDVYPYILICETEIVGEDSTQRPIIIKLTKEGTMELKK